jgi:hypothetical protein
MTVTAAIDVHRALGLADQDTNGMDKSEGKSRLKRVTGVAGNR